MIDVDEYSGCLSRYLTTFHNLYLTYRLMIWS